MGFKDKYFAKSYKENDCDPTRYLYFGGVGDQMNSNIEILRSVLSSFGELDSEFFDSSEENSVLGIYFPPQKRFCFAVFKDISSAVSTYCYFSKNSDCPELNVKNIDVKYAHVQNKTNPLPECTSESSSIFVPGLILLEDFIDDTMERHIADEIDGENVQWRESLSRRVQHYGFSFSYRTLMIDYTKPTAIIPQRCCELVNQITSAITQSNIAENINPLNQLTVNEYYPGQGISSHTDTETCFGPMLCILSLYGGIVMCFTKNEPTHNEDGQIVHVKKQLYLPSRSLLILSGDARYNWNHGIIQRKLDKVDGVLLQRTRRISLTFRQVLGPGPIPSGSLVSGDIEKEHVVKVYDAIAVHWNHTRGKRKVHWHRVKEFLETLPVGSFLADIGSGDGKYFGLNPNVVTIGCDRSLRLLEVSRELTHETFACDAVKVPFLSQSFDAVICIAVLHHLATIERRFSVINELVRIAKVGGTIFLQAWALEQGHDSKRNFASQDTMVPWKLNKRFTDPRTNSSVPSPLDQDEILVYDRYCHVYREGELEELCSRVPFCKIVDAGWDRGNWFVQLVKINDFRLVDNEIECTIPNFIPRKATL